jgi:hypothetical protein
MFPAVSLRKSADYKQVPVRFDGTQHHSETASTSPGPRGLNLPRPKPPIVAVTQQNVRDWWARFVNRKAYTQQSANPHPDRGRHYHYQPKNNNKDSGQPLELDPATVRKHLAGDREHQSPGKSAWRQGSGQHRMRCPMRVSQD